MKPLHEVTYAAKSGVAGDLDTLFIVDPVGPGKDRASLTKFTFVCFLEQRQVVGLQ
jgi:hypothetical protein